MADLTFSSASTVDIARGDDVLTDAIATPGDFKAIQIKVDGYASDTSGPVRVTLCKSIDNSQFDSVLSAENLGTFYTDKDKPIIKTLLADTRGVSHIKLLIANNSSDQVTVTGVI